MRYLPVKPEGSLVHTWRGREVLLPFLFVWRVLDLPLYFNEDLEQCADWAFRLWYDYQRETKAGERLWLIDYNGRKKTLGEWKTSKPGADAKGFLRWSMANANSYSQKKGLFTVPSEKELLPGDLLVQNETGGIGHTSIVFDVAENAEGKRLYLLGFGFMPAQEAHIEKAAAEQGQGGWFTLEGYRRYLKNHFSFGEPVMRSFERRGTRISERPISFSDARKRATEDYIAQHYGLSGREAKIDPKMIVLHWTGIRDVEAAWKTFDKETLPKERGDISAGGGLNVSAHFLVGRDGRILQLMPPDRMARHAIGLNLSAIGIENVGGVDDRDDLTPAQAEADAWLIRRLKGEFPGIEYLIGHHEYLRFEGHPLWLENQAGYRTQKSDPGDRFMREVRTRIKDLGLKGPP